MKNSLWIDTHIHPKFRKGLNVKETIFDDTLSITIQNPAIENVDSRVFEYFMYIMLALHGLTYNFSYEMNKHNTFKNVTINIMHFSEVQNGKSKEK